VRRWTGLDVLVEIDGQVVWGRVLRSLLGLYRVQLPTVGGAYVLRWIPRWRILEVEESVRRAT
jgi:hypothetical protein